MLPLRRSKACCLGRSPSVSRVLVRVLILACRKACRPGVGPMNVPSVLKPSALRVLIGVSLLFALFRVTGEFLSVLATIGSRLVLSLLRIYILSRYATIVL